MTFLKKDCLPLMWFILFIEPLHSQTISIPDTLKGWGTIWMASLNESQAPSTNWSQGGASSISGAGFYFIKPERKKGVWSSSKFNGFGMKCRCAERKKGIGLRCVPTAVGKETYGDGIITFRSAIIIFS